MYAVSVVDLPGEVEGLDSWLVEPRRRLNTHLDMRRRQWKKWPPWI
jgi:hypothetical protein